MYERILAKEEYQKQQAYAQQVASDCATQRYVGEECDMRLSEIERLTMRLGASVDQARHVAQRVSDLADRIFGAQTLAKNEAQPAPTVTGGSILNLESHLDMIGYALDRAQGELSRLERL